MFHLIFDKYCRTLAQQKFILNILLSFLFLLFIFVYTSFFILWSYWKDWCDMDSIRSLEGVVVAWDSIWERIHKMLPVIYTKKINDADKLKKWRLYTYDALIEVWYFCVIFLFHKFNRNNCSYAWSKYWMHRQRFWNYKSAKHNTEFIHANLKKYKEEKL